jgi:hypothetical protein
VPVFSRRIASAQCLANALGQTSIFGQYAQGAIVKWVSSTVAIAGNCGRAAGNRLEKYDPKAFASTRHDEHIRIPVKRWQLLMPYPS